MSCKNQISVEEMLIKVNNLDTYIIEEDMIKFWFLKKTAYWYISRKM